MFGRKNKKGKNGKIKFSSLSKEEQARELARVKRIGDHIAETYERLMRERLDNAKAVVEQGISNHDNSDDK